MSQLVTMMMKHIGSINPISLSATAPRSAYQTSHYNAANKPSQTCEHTTSTKLAGSFVSSFTIVVNKWFGASTTLQFPKPS